MVPHEFDEIRPTVSRSKRPDVIEAARRAPAEKTLNEDDERTKHLEAEIDNILDMIRPEDSEKPQIQEKLRKLYAILSSSSEGQQVLPFPAESSKKTSNDILRQRGIEDRARTADQKKQPREKRKYQHSRATIEDEGPSRKKKRQIQDRLWDGGRPGGVYAMIREMRLGKRGVSGGSVMDKSMDDSALEENWSVAATAGKRRPKLPRPETPELCSTASGDARIPTTETVGRTHAEDMKMLEEFSKRYS